MSASTFPAPVATIAQLPERRDRGIGIIGAGQIVTASHLPAYRRAGFNVRAILDQDHARATAAAEAFGIPSVCGSVDEMLAISDVEIIDIAVPPAVQAQIVPAAVAAGKHVLCQKPFATTYEVASTLVEAARKAGRKIAVNQQMRWTHAIASMKALLQAGSYGTVAGASFDIDILSAWPAWVSGFPRLEFLFHSIHYFDAVRYLFGEPSAVFAMAGRHPNQVEAGETRTLAVLEYSELFRVLISVNHANWSTAPRAIVRCDGTAGRSEGTLGALYDYPRGRADTLAFTSRSDGIAEATVSMRFEEQWFPDAFIGPMAELMLAIEEDREPLTAGADNLKTLRLLELAYESAAGGHVVAVP